MHEMWKGDENTMKHILNVDVLKKKLDSSEIYEDEDGNKIQTVYLGSILDLTPLGKIYYPFAHSNVDGCPRCKGEGTIKNKHGKKKKFDKLRKKEHTIIKYLMKEARNYLNWTEKQQKKIDKIRKQEEHWNPWITCNECYGLGSLEARLDQDWWEELEKELETINAWHHSSEGDGCDVMISKEVENK